MEHKKELPVDVHKKRTYYQRLGREKTTKRARVLRRPPRAKTLQYPKGYFLGLLDRKMNVTYYSYNPPYDHTRWWERRSRKQYDCSICGKTIEKGKRYIGYRKLIPGYRGIYGRRGTYYTYCFHIKCLLEVKKKTVEEEVEVARLRIRVLEKEITSYIQEVSVKEARIRTHQTGKKVELLHPEISAIEKEILDTEKEITLKKSRINTYEAEIETLQAEIERAKIEREKASFWRKVGNWISYTLSIGSKRFTISSRETSITGIKKEIRKHEVRIIELRDVAISRLEAAISRIKDKEIPSRRTEISELQRKINKLETKRTEIQARIEELRVL